MEEFDVEISDVEKMAIQLLLAEILSPEKTAAFIATLDRGKAQYSGVGYFLTVPHNFDEVVERVVISRITSCGSKWFVGSSEPDNDNLDLLLFVDIEPEKTICLECCADNSMSPTGRDRMKSVNLTIAKDA